MCHLRSADSQPQGLIKLQFRDRLCIRIRGVRPQIMTRFCSKVCRLDAGTVLDRKTLDIKDLAILDTSWFGQDLQDKHTKTV